MSAQDPEYQKTLNKYIRNALLFNKSQANVGSKYSFRTIL